MNYLEIEELEDSFKELDDITCVLEYRRTNNNLYLESLLARYTKYINKVLGDMFSKYNNKYDWCDLRQEIILSFIGIVKHKFKPDNGVKFFTYLFKTLKLDSLKFIRDDRYYPAKRTYRLSPIGNVHSFLDLKFFNKHDVNDIGIGSSEIEKMDNIMANEKNECFVSKRLDDDVKTMYDFVIESMDGLLTSQQKYIIIEYYVNERKQVDIAKDLNTNQACVFRSLKKATNILKDYWNEKNIFI